MLAQQRRPYGQLSSDSYLLTFDATNENEAKARKMAQQLASQRKLKQALISVLCAVNDAQEASGRPIDFSEFTARFVSGILGGGVGLAPMPPITDMTIPDQLPGPWTGTAEHADPVLARETLQATMGNLLDEDDDF